MYLASNGIQSTSENLNEIILQLAHDLKSPLQVIKSILGCETLKSSLPIENHKLLEKSLGRLNAISSDLLKSEPRDFCLKNMLIDLVREKSLETGLTQEHFELQILSTNTLVHLNESMLYRCLSNVLNNAIEAFAPGDEFIQLEIKLREVHEFLEVIIVDNGKGISPKDMQLITKRGFSTKESGFGLGLFGTQKFLEKIGGKLEIKSTLGHGTQVSLKLPLQNFSNSSRSVSCVLIDDDEIIRRLWENHARRKGYSLLTFASVEDFLVNAHDLNRRTTLFIDSYLKDGKRGEIEAYKLAQMGFENLYLATAREDLDLTNLPQWITGIVGKEPVYS